MPTPGPSTGRPGAAGCASTRPPRWRPSASARCSSLRAAAGLRGRRRRHASARSCWPQLRARLGGGQQPLEPVGAELLAQPAVRPAAAAWASTSPSWEDLACVLIALLVRRRPGRRRPGRWWDRRRQDPWLRLQRRVQPRLRALGVRAAARTTGRATLAAARAPAASATRARAAGSCAAARWNAQRYARSRAGALGRALAARASTELRWPAAALPDDPRHALDPPPPALALPPARPGRALVPRPAPPRARQEARARSSAPRAADGTPYAAREDAHALCRRGGRAPRPRSATGCAQLVAQARRLPAVQRLMHAAAGRHGQELGRLPQPLHRAACASRPACASGRTTRDGAGARRAALRRAGRDRRRHRRRRDLLRPAAWATSACSTRWPRWPSTSRQRTRARRPQRLLPRRAGAVPGAAQPRRASTRCAPRGSYAGAMGLPQFMPSSSTAGRSTSTATAASTCARSPADVIGWWPTTSAFGWQPRHAHALPGALRRWTRLRPRRAAGARHPAHLQRRAASPAKGARAGRRRRCSTTGRWRWWNCRTAATAPSYVAGTQNFYAITRYNWSSYYAMAVIELGREVKAALPGAERAGPGGRPVSPAAP